jgi:hypothetical protein
VSVSNFATSNKIQINTNNKHLLIMENTHIEPPPFKVPEQQVTEAQREKGQVQAHDAVDGLPAELAALGLDNEVSSHISEMLRNAEAQGYLRGRNEKIEVTQHFDPDPELEPQPTGIPLYNRRSIWD